MNRIEKWSSWVKDCKLEGVILQSIGKEELMRIASYRLVGVLAILMAVMGCKHSRPSVAAPRVAGGDKREIQLFNGKNLDGWIWVTDSAKHPNVKMEDVWDVRD